MAVMNINGSRQEDKEVAKIGENIKKSRMGHISYCKCYFHVFNMHPPTYSSRLHISLVPVGI
jgi:hypothetical protein